MRNPIVDGAWQTGERLLVLELDLDFTDPTGWGFHCPHAEQVRGHTITRIRHFQHGFAALYVDPPISPEEKIPNQAVIMFGIPDTVKMADAPKWPTCAECGMDSNFALNGVVQTLCYDHHPKGRTATGSLPSGPPATSDPSEG